MRQLSSNIKGKWKYLKDKQLYQNVTTGAKSLLPRRKFFTMGVDPLIEKVHIGKQA